MNIDREIAEKIMGWIDPDPVESNMWCDKSHFPTSLKSMWHPSTDIKQAFEVVEKMREKGSIFTLCDQDPGEKPEWDAQFFSVIATDDTPAMAICLAALKAVEV